jgi:hypothetical protein
MAIREFSADAATPLDHWSQLEFSELLSAACDAFAAGRLDAARTICLVGLSRFPDAAALLAILGWVQAQRSEWTSAEVSFHHALCHDPQSVDSHSGLAAVLAAAGRFEEAEPHYQHAIELHASDSQTLLNFGCTLLALRRFARAIEVLERAVAIDPTLIEAYHNLAVARAQLGEWEAAVECCERALVLDSRAQKVRLLRGMARVALKNFGAGWDDYEVRCELRTCELDRIGLPRWQGPGDQKQSIAVMPEQGLGTQVLFASCCRELAEHVSQVTVGVEPRLVGLLRRSLPGIHVVAGDLLPALAADGLIDAYVWAGSLSSVFRRSAEAFPGDAYLVAEPLAAESWQRRLDDLGPGLKVGVAWGGGGKTVDTAHRRTQPNDWRQVAALAGVEWINLQCDALPEDLAYWRSLAGERFHDWNDFNKKYDLENFVGLVSQLDLVMTVVNSTAHIAGALGVPTWTLVPLGGEWRWQASGASCLWHRSVRLFRQQRLDDWSGVFDELRTELAQRIESSHSLRSNRAA